jgi:hypothetical protein
LRFEIHSAKAKVVSEEVEVCRTGSSYYSHQNKDNQGIEICRQLLTVPIPVFTIADANDRPFHSPGEWVLGSISRISTGSNRYPTHKHGFSVSGRHAGEMSDGGLCIAIRSQS